ncbi:hypothetical protein J2S74_004511 [Evansella vedderi]|uniref:Uncharacterized protein n=1 Tax=Evansella vedderi TaxID=38282 RepID=A0ABU0A279_9BACI|nr:hypothetical protein [Evansella vedderi]
MSSWFLFRFPLKTSRDGTFLGLKCLIPSIGETIYKGWMVSLGLYRLISYDDMFISNVPADSYVLINATTALAYILVSIFLAMIGLLIILNAFYYI